MTRQDSESEIAGQLGAQLTPALPRTPLQRAGEQNSGLFDIGALYAASVEQVMRRAQKARQASPFVGITEMPAPVVDRRRVERPVRLHEAETLIEEYEEPIFIPGVARRGRIGWYAIAVAWLATATLGAAIATGLPAHAMARAKQVTSPLAGTAPVAAIPTVAATPIAIAIATPTATATGTPTPTATATPTPATTPPTTLAATPTPSATATPPAAKPRISPPAVAARPSPVAHITQTESPVAAPPPVAKASVAADVAPAPKPAPAKASPAAAPAPAPAGTSLEDLIRQAVAAESKKH